MRTFGTKMILAAAMFAAPLIVTAQTPPPAPAAPQGPPSWAGQGWGQRMGPGFGRMGRGMGPQMGMRRGWALGRGFGMRGRAFGRGRGAFGAGRGAGLGRLLDNPTVRERLGVTPEQAAKIQSQQDAFAQSRIRTHADLQAKRMELDQLMRAESPDRALIDKKMRELSDARLAAEKFQFDHQLTMRNALSPEQKKKLEDWRKEMRQNRMQRGPGFGPRRGPGGFGPAQPPNPPASPAPPAPPNNPDGL